MLGEFDERLTRQIQVLSIGPLEYLLLHYYMPFAPKVESLIGVCKNIPDCIHRQGRFDESSGAFGWKGNPHQLSERRP